VRSIPRSRPNPQFNQKPCEQSCRSTKVGEAKALAITEVFPAPNATFAAHSEVLQSHLVFDIHAAGIVDYDLFESIYNPGKMPAPHVLEDR